MAYKEFPSVTLDEMLYCREQRAILQKELLQKYQKPLISFTLNIPGEQKVFPLSQQTFQEGKQLLLRQLERNHIPLLYEKHLLQNTGEEGFYVVEGNALQVKELVMTLEDSHPLGRLFDLDVLDTTGEIIKLPHLRLQERTCLLCEKPVWECARNRTHTSVELVKEVQKQMKTYFQEKFANKIASCAIKSLLYELQVTPKPGLVDQKNSGAHKDMDAFTFLDSISVLSPYFQECTKKGCIFNGQPPELLPTLRLLGLEAEHIMFSSTGGVNTHKGAIFSLGLLCATVGYAWTHSLATTLPEFFSLVQQVAQPVLQDFSHPPQSNGEFLFAKDKIRGARGEASAGYPSVEKIGLPILEKTLTQGFSYNDAGVITLLHLIAHVEDSNILHRSDSKTLNAIQHSLKTITTQNLAPSQLLALAEQLDVQWSATNISPGGCADLLGVTFFLHFLTKEWAEE